MAVKTWGKNWSGKTIQIFCDNDAVCDVILYLKPKDANMQVHLREFLFWVCKYNFHPIISKIGSKENDIADFLSRNFSESDANMFFTKNFIPPQKKLYLSDSDFLLKADW